MAEPVFEGMPLNLRDVAPSPGDNAVDSRLLLPEEPAHRCWITARDCGMIGLPSPAKARPLLAADLTAYRTAFEPQANVGITTCTDSSATMSLR